MLSLCNNHSFNQLLSMELQGIIKVGFVWLSEADSHSCGTIMRSTLMQSLCFVAGSRSQERTMIKETALQ